MIRVIINICSLISARVGLCVPEDQGCQAETCRQPENRDLSSSSLLRWTDDTRRDLINVAIWHIESS